MQRLSLLCIAAITLSFTPATKSFSPKHVTLEQSCMAGFGFGCAISGIALQIVNPHMSKSAKTGLMLAVSGTALLGCAALLGLAHALERISFQLSYLQHLRKNPAEDEIDDRTAACLVTLSALSVFSVIMALNAHANKA